MSDTPTPPGKGPRRRTRVDFRRNRQKPGRKKYRHTTGDEPERNEAGPERESIRAKGDLSRKRTVTDHADGASDAGLRPGLVVAARGQYVEVDDGERIWLCTIRRILRTRQIEQRAPVAVGDQVLFSVVSESEGVHREGVIVQVAPRRTVLERSDGRRTHVIAVNVDQVLVIASLREPMLKPHLIDRYLVAAHAGGLPAIVVVNKIDLGPEDELDEVLERYQAIGYAALGTSAAEDRGVDELRGLMKDKVSLIAGQSGVGKSSLLNAIQPGLRLKTGAVSASTEKGRHTTTTAVYLKLDFGGAVIDTPGIRALDVAMVPLQEIELHFVEFVDRMRDCKFPDCVHVHEIGCAIKDAVDAGEIDPSRYESYVQLFAERSEQ